MPSNIVCLHGQFAGQTFTLGNETFVIGRSPSSTVELSSKLIGRRHAEIRFDGASYMLYDQQSRNGTFVNGERVQDARPLRHGDEIAMGDEIFRFDAPTATPQLVGFVGPLAGQRFALYEQPLTIGRGDDNAVVITSRQSSRHHAEIRFDGGNYVLYDQQSRNGTLVNGERVQDARPLRHGDEIAIGGESFRFEAEVLEDDDSTQIPASSSQMSATGPTPEFGIQCPACQRVIVPQHQHCPWDGALLANGHTALAAPAAQL